MHFRVKLVNSLIILLVFAYYPLLSSQKTLNDKKSATEAPEEPPGSAEDSESQPDGEQNAAVNKSTKFLPPVLDGADCYPAGSNGAAQYLIGYGSLMQKASKDRSYPGTGESIPVRVYGFSRSFTCKGESAGLSTTYLGTDTSDNKSAFFNAVFFKVPNAAAIAIYDTREKFYCREEVPTSKMQLLTNRTNVRTFPAGQYWLYVTRPEYREPPTDEYPIVESYVDTFLAGCIEVEEKYNLTGFAEECVHSTSEWENPWKNDRIYPRRPFIHFPMAGKVDRLLNKTVESAFKNIQVEG